MRYTSVPPIRTQCEAELDRYESLSGDVRDAAIPGSDKELIRYGVDIERLSGMMESAGAAAAGTAGVEFAYLRDRVASIPATSLAGAAVKLRGLIAGRARGMRLGEVEMVLLQNVLEIVEAASTPHRVDNAVQVLTPSPLPAPQPVESDIEITIEIIIQIIIIKASASPLS